MRRELVFFLEEESAKNMLEGLWPRIAPPDGCVYPVFIVFEGKSDLERQFPRKMAGYINPDARFIILRDQDSGDCHVIKQKLVALCCASSRGRPYLVRIACKELESWYIAQLDAVDAGLNMEVAAKHRGKAKFRDPDRLGSPSRELEMLTNGMYEKGIGSRSIGPYLDPDCARSKSYVCFIDAVRTLCR